MSKFIATELDAYKEQLFEELKKINVDVVEVVRCKDCKYRKKLPNVSYGECIYSASMVSDNDYCSNGERKQDK